MEARTRARECLEQELHRRQISLLLSTNLIWGDGSAHYLWEAASETLYFYNTDTIFIELENS